MNYRRARVDGGTYFFTVVAFMRRPVLCADGNVAVMKNAFRHVMRTHPFTVDAMVLLPDHLHCMWTLPAGDRDFSTRWRLIKTRVTRGFAGSKPARSAARAAKNEQTVWQRRFWEHLIRDERDYTNHVEYIHYNPVKHGHANAPGDWPHSTFHRFVQQGLYPKDWGRHEKINTTPGIGNE